MGWEGGHAQFHSASSYTIPPCHFSPLVLPQGTPCSLESWGTERPLPSRAFSEAKDCSLNRPHIPSEPSGEGRVMQGLPLPREETVIAHLTSSSYKNQTRQRHSASTRRDIPLFRATGTATSTARTPRVWVRVPRAEEAIHTRSLQGLLG